MNPSNQQLSKPSSCEKAHGCHSKNFDGASPAYKQALIVVILINAGMFLREFTAGFSADSQALKADALDFLMDSMTYTISLAVIGHSLNLRSMAALIKGYSLSAIALIILASSIYNIIENNTPEPTTIGTVAIIALLSNLLCLLILVKFKDGDANVRSTWLCSRNDSIGNALVIVSAVCIYFTQSHWPDLIVAIFLASLFLKSSIQIIRQATSERQNAST